MTSMLPSSYGRHSGENSRSATTSPAPSATDILERVRDLNRDTSYAVRVTIPKLMADCPFSSQSMFAHVVVDYVPDGWLLDAASLSNYLEVYRYRGAFHETCTVSVGKDLAAFLEPKWLRIGGYWNPMGGIPVDVFYQTGMPPAGIWIPEQPRPPAPTPG